MTSRYINCTEHGNRHQAFICRHLNKELAVGFHETFESDPGEEYSNGELNAWCDECNHVLKEVGEWNEESELFAQVKMCCDVCYFEIKKLNRPPSIWDRILRRGYIHDRHK